jgi:PPOX class probable F420-dependent enzyme
MPSHPMTDQEVAAFLQSEPARTAKVATVRADGSPHVAPVWFALDTSTVTPDSPIGDIVFNTGTETLKGRNLRRDPRIALCVDDERAPFSFVNIVGTATLSDDIDLVRQWATLLGARYMGAARGDEYGQRNGVPGELFVRMRPSHIVAVADLA